MKKKWWHGKVAYQIYPKSFNDTTGNGVGDLRGIIEKLDYLKELGVDIIWLSPCYCSPFADQGYDISDYYNIDPVFGNMDDMDELLAEAKKRDMYILMDLVVNHCSDEHEWFKKAMADPDGEYGKYFYIEEGKDGKEPNNWRSYFGGSAWEKIPGTNKYYLHLFHKKQPDLNWENKKVRDEIYTMINWWFEKGLAGFRIDAIINIKKALPIIDYCYSPDREDGFVEPHRMLKDAIGVGDFLTELKNETFAKHDAFTVGEVFDEREEDIPLFIGDDGYFSSMFDFNETIFGKSRNGWYDCKPITPDDYKRCCFETQEKIGDIGMISTIIENHDEPRGVSHYIPADELSETAKKFLGTMQFMLRGLPFIYQGQEIGMENVNFTSMEQIDDISTRDQYRVAIEAGISPEEAFASVKHYSRDNSRTPFQWDDSKNAGFTTGTPWLMVSPDYKRINAASQINDPNSLLSYYKKLTALRKNPEYSETVVYGKTVPYLPETSRLMAFERVSENQTLLVLGNFQTQPQTVKLPSKCKKVVLNNLENVDFVSDTEIKLEGYQALVVEI
ncbi:glycoside hydrolase family 13 protein [Lachnoanaerobaculum umeaense]|uniref:Alpha-glucosidase n=1 Tax=Lachnoanaerobaculum umeaense TaxID=617123 RepID=A0A385Q2V1_9FIRM|nr:alpha-glucosidase [Lachnoanaerobaculum umeaense]AYB00691.1 alpha-glucosidase [Lachnoanaerobaculum umeaense]PZW95580.1 oligo-1,6-glucosidase [Lachnoanaerobaculum umeaense]